MKKFMLIPALLLISKLCFSAAPVLDESLTVLQPAITPGCENGAATFYFTECMPDLIVSITQVDIGLPMGFHSIGQQGCGFDNTQSFIVASLNPGLYILNASNLGEAMAPHYFEIVGPDPLLTAEITEVVPPDEWDLGSMDITYTFGAGGCYEPEAFIYASNGDIYTPYAQDGHTFKFGGLPGLDICTKFEVRGISVDMVSFIGNVTPEFATAPGEGNTYFEDLDGDGYGNPATSITSCTTPDGYVDNNLDCDDSQILYVDADGDGFGADITSACGVLNNDDCNDVNIFIHPGAAEIADGIDNDCDGIIDPCSTPTNLATDYINVSSARFNWGAVASAVKYNIRYRVIGTTTWIKKTKNAPNTKLTISGLPASTSYEWQVRSDCGGTKSSYSPSVYFTTPSAKMAETDVNFVPNYQMEIFPNPASEEFNLHLYADDIEPKIAQINIYNLTGQLVYSSESVIVNGELNKMINAQDLSEGIHIVKIVFGENFLSSSVMITK